MDEMKCLVNLTKDYNPQNILNHVQTRKMRVWHVLHARCALYCSQFFTVASVIHDLWLLA